MGYLLVYLDNPIRYTVNKKLHVSTVGKYIFIRNQNITETIVRNKDLNETKQGEIKYVNCSNIIMLNFKIYFLLFLSDWLSIDN